MGREQEHKDLWEVAAGSIKDPGTYLAKASDYAVTDTTARNLGRAIVESAVSGGRRALSSASGLPRDQRTAEALSILQRAATALQEVGYDPATDTVVSRRR